MRLRATSPTYSQVTIVIVDEPGQDRFSVLCLETSLSAPQLIRRWRRRNWIEVVFRTLKHLLATEAWQVHNEDAYYGYLVLRLMASFVLHVAGHLQRACNDGRDHLSFKALLAFCRSQSPCITSAFIEYRWESHMERG